MSTKKEWRYFDEKIGDWTKEYVSLDDLAHLHSAGDIQDDTHCYSRLMLRYRGPRSNGIPYSSITRLSIKFSPDVEELYATRDTHFVTVLCGPNNCGKTLLLKQLFSLVGQGGYLVSCNRFSHVDM